jgi:hypothetical protein
VPRAAQEKCPDDITGFRRFHLGAADLVIHAAHTAHTTARHSRSSAVLLRPFGDHGFRGDQKPGDRRCILQGRPNNLGRVYNALVDEVHVFAVLGVEAEAVLIVSRILPTMMEAARPVAKQMPSLNLCLVRLRRFSPLNCRWQLKHRGLLSLLKQSQKNDLAVREFQGVMVRPGDALIDLAKDRGLVLDSAAVPRPQTYPFNLACEGQLCAGQ